MTHVRRRDFYGDAHAQHCDRAKKVIREYGESNAEEWLQGAIHAYVMQLWCIRGQGATTRFIGDLIRNRAKLGSRPTLVWNRDSAA